MFWIGVCWYQYILHVLSGLSFKGEYPWRINPKLLLKSAIFSDTLNKIGLTKSFYSLIKPERKYYNYRCSQVHGLCSTDTDNASIFPEVWKQIEPLIEGLPLVAHNKAFDESCPKAVFRVCQMDYPDYEFHCTCIASHRRWPGMPNNLDVAAARCRYYLKNHHHALADAEACAAIALQLL